MASETGELLSRDAARVILEAQLKQLVGIGASWWLAFTQRPESLTPSYDTLVIELQEPQLLTDERHSIDNVPVVVREVLLVLHALSRCRGFSYRDYPAFWTSALPRTTRDTQFDIARPSRVFPRVVLACFHSHVGGFQRKVLDAFFPARMGEPNQSAEQTIERLNGYTSTAPSEPIECFVRIQLAKTANDTEDILAYVTSQLDGIDEAREGNPLQLMGLELMGRRKHSRSSGLKVMHLKPLQALFTNLPQSMTLALRFPHNLGGFSDRSAADTRVVTPAQATGFDSFFKRACGFQSSEFAGRLEVLDLIGAFGRSRRHFAQCNFASFCTLLPSTTSLQEIRVRIDQATDWLWLAYAMFHPQSRQSAWRRLVMCVDLNQNPFPTNWQAVERFLQAGASSTVLADLLIRGQRVVAPSGQREQARATCRTATTIKRTTVYHTDKTRRLVTLPRGETVAVCGAESDDGDSVFVLVPGYSFGYTSKSCLSSIRETEDAGPPKSCIKSLHVAGVEQLPKTIRVEDQLGILQLFGPSLKHLRVSQSNWFRQRGFSQHVPTKLQELHLQLTVSPEDVSRVESLIKQYFGRLSHFKLAAQSSRAIGYRSISLRGIATNSRLGRSKRAFLSAVDTAHTQWDEKSSALARLDSSLIRQVFDFWGLRLESLVVSGDAYYGYQSPMPHENDTHGDSWFSPTSDS